MSEELLVLQASWPVSTIEGEPSITTGTLSVLLEPGGDYLLSVSSGDENHPDNTEVQFPLSAAEAKLVQRALGGAPTAPPQTH